MTNVSNLAARQNITNERIASLPPVERALVWASMGFAVFPLRNKTPAIGKQDGGKGHLDATTDPDLIRGLFEKAPHATEVGIRTGKHSGVMVVDADLYKGHQETREYVTQAGVTDTITMEVETQSGGKHFYFKQYKDTRSCVPAKGVELKAEGGYVVAPNGKSYRVVSNHLSVADFPPDKSPMLKSANAALGDRLGALGPVDAAINDLMSLDTVHDSALKISSNLASFGVPPDQIKRHLDALINSACRKASKDQQARVDQVKDRQERGEFDRMIKTAVDKFKPVDDTEFVDLLEKETGKTLKERLNDTHRAPDVIDKLLPKEVVTAIYGADGVGKTALAIYFAVCIAAGIDPFDTNGERSDPKSVWLILVEDSEAVTLGRIDATMNALKLTEDEKEAVFSNIYYPDDFMLEDVMLLQKGRDKETFIETVHESKFMQTIRQRLDLVGGYDVIILDPILDFYEGGQNDNQQVSRFIRYLGRLAKEYIMAVMFLGHTARAEGSEFAGARAWSSKLRSRMWTEEAKNGFTLFHRKCSYGEERDDVSFMFNGDGVPLPVDDVLKDELDKDRLENINSDIFRSLDLAASMEKILGLGNRSDDKAWEFINEKFGTDYSQKEIIDAVDKLVAQNVLTKSHKFNGLNNTPHITYANRSPKSGLWFVT